MTQVSDFESTINESTPNNSILNNIPKVNVACVQQMRHSPKAMIKALMCR